MRRLWISLAALAGFASGFVAAWLVGVGSTVSSDCDGPCFDQWDEVFYIAIGVGVACAIAAGLAARSLIKWR